MNCIINKVQCKVIMYFINFLQCFQSAKERGRAGRGEGIHYYSYKNSFSLCGLRVTTFSNECKFDF